MSITSTLLATASQDRTTVALTLLLGTCVAVWLRRWYEESQFMSDLEAKHGKLTDIPGPTPLPVVGNIFEGDDMLDVRGSTSRLHKKYGPVVAFKAGPQKMLFVSDPAIVREIITTRRADFVNSEIMRTVLGHFYPRSLIVLHETEEWATTRKLLLNAITGHKLEGMLPTMTRGIAQAEKTIDSANGEPVDVTSLFACFLVDVFGVFAYDHDFGTMRGESMELLEALLLIGEAIASRMMVPFPALWRIPTTFNRRVWQAERTVRKYSQMLVAERMRDMEKMAAGERATAATRDMMSALLLAVKKDGEMDSELLHDNLAILFIASYETTINSISAALNMLARNPEVQAKARRELVALRDEVGLTNDTWLSAPVFQQAEYLAQVVKETMRLMPVAFGIPRTTTKPVVLGNGKQNYLIPENTVCILNTYAMSRDPEIWNTTPEDAVKLRPERWEELTGEEGDRKFAFIPFGVGSRMCIGSRIALYEMTAVISSLLLRYELLPGSDVESEWTIRVALTPKDGMPVRFKKIKV